MNFNRSNILIKNLFPLFFVLICYFANANCVNNQPETKWPHKQLLITNSYLPGLISEGNLISDELDSTNLAFESIVVEKQLQIYINKNSCGNSDRNNITKIPLFPLLYDLPPPNSNILI